MIEGSNTTDVAFVTVANGGSNYTTPPQVTFSPPPSGGVTATGVAVIQSGQIVGVTVTNPGAGYSATPTITFGGPGTGASVVAALAANLTVAVGETADVSGLTLDGNHVAVGGIAMSTGANLLLQNVVVQNVANQVNGGGVLSLNGNVSVIRSQFIDDVAEGDGGAIANVGGSLSISQSTFSGNLAPGGVAIYNVAGPAGGGGTLSVSESTFADNQAVGRGGALDLEPGSLATVVDSTFSGNFAGVNGGGGGAIGVFTQSNIQTAPSSLVLTSSTLSGNQVSARGFGAGLYVQASASALVRDTIVAGNHYYNGPASDVSGVWTPPATMI